MCLWLHDGRATLWLFQLNFSTFISSPTTPTLLTSSSYRASSHPRDLNCKSVQSVNHLWLAFRASVRAKNQWPTWSLRAFAPEQYYAGQSLAPLLLPLVQRRPENRYATSCRSFGDEQGGIFPSCLGTFVLFEKFEDDKVLNLSHLSKDEKSSQAYEIFKHCPLQNQFFYLLLFKTTSSYLKHF